MSTILNLINAGRKDISNVCDSLAYGFGGHVKESDGTFSSYDPFKDPELYPLRAKEELQLANQTKIEGKCVDTVTSTGIESNTIEMPSITVTSTPSEKVMPIVLTQDPVTGDYMPISGLDLLQSKDQESKAVATVENTQPQQNLCSQINCDCHSNNKLPKELDKAIKMIDGCIRPVLEKEGISIVASQSGNGLISLYSVKNIDNTIIQNSGIVIDGVGMYYDPRAKWFDGERRVYGFDDKKTDPLALVTVLSGQRLPDDVPQLYNEYHRYMSDTFCDLSKISLDNLKRREKIIDRITSENAKQVFNHALGLSDTKHFKIGKIVSDEEFVLDDDYIQSNPNVTYIHFTKVNGEFTTNVEKVDKETYHNKFKIEK